MSGLLVDKDLCIGCGLCVKACGNAGIVVEGERPNRLARATDGCILCGACVQACPKKAISIARDEDGDETPQQRASRLAAYKDVWVFAQVDQTGRALPVAFELLGRARELAAVRGCRVVALLGQGATAPQAAGVIHTDFERGFIKAETIAYDDYVELGGEQGAKAAGRLRMEGKDYVMHDGDVVHFRFNV